MRVAERRGRTNHLRKTRHVLVTLEQLARERPEYQPSIPELVSLTGMSIEGVLAALKTLRDDYGYVAQADANVRAASRTIRLIQPTY